MLPVKLCAPNLYPFGIKGTPSAFLCRWLGTGLGTTCVRFYFHTGVILTQAKYALKMVLPYLSTNECPTINTTGGEYCLERLSFNSSNVVQGFGISTGEWEFANMNIRGTHYFGAGQKVRVIGAGLRCQLDCVNQLDSGLVECGNYPYYFGKVKWNGSLPGHQWDYDPDAWTRMTPFVESSKHVMSGYPIIQVRRRYYPQEDEDMIEHLPFRSYCHDDPPAGAAACCGENLSTSVRSCPWSLPFIRISGIQDTGSVYARVSGVLFLEVPGSNYWDNVYTRSALPVGCCDNWSHRQKLLSYCNKFPLSRVWYR